MSNINNQLLAELTAFMSSQEKVRKRMMMSEETMRELLRQVGQPAPDTILGREEQQRLRGGFEFLDGHKITINPFIPPGQVIMVDDTACDAFGKSDFLMDLVVPRLDAGDPLFRLQQAYSMPRIDSVSFIVTDSFCPSSSAPAPTPPPSEAEKPKEEDDRNIRYLDM